MLAPCHVRGSFAFMRHVALLYLLFPAVLSANSETNRRQTQAGATRTPAAVDPCVAYLVVRPSSVYRLEDRI